MSELPEIKHTHFIMEFDNDEEFRYYDEKLNKATLKSMLLNYKKTIKDALLDQSLIAGIGNIYADEILFSI